MSNRDTQFAGWAKLLLGEITNVQDGMFDVSDWWKEQAQEVIARKAYDFAKHTMSHVSQGMSAENEGGPKYLEENVRYIPDMTELPKEQDGQRRERQED